MTQREICEKIIEQDGCAGISCFNDHCQFRDENGWCISDGSDYVELAKDWLKITQKTKTTKKPLITDQIIAAILATDSIVQYHGESISFSKIKEQLRQKGYEVEQKSKLEQARECNTDTLDNVLQKIELYEAAVKELEDRIKELERKQEPDDIHGWR
jgi:predicted RNase H-like nuclease (RuvC/YqgF family)